MGLWGCFALTEVAVSFTSNTLLRQAQDTLRTFGCHAER